MLTSVPQELLYQRKDALDLRLGEMVNKPSTQASYQFSILGAPDDRGVAANHGRIGAAQAPDKIREQFYKLCAFNTKNYSLEDLGNLSLSASLEDDHRIFASHITEQLRTSTACILLGGGNDYAYADVVGLFQHTKNAERLGLINIDAHFDVRDLRFGITSGTPFYRVLEDSPVLIKPEHFVEFACQERVNAIHYTDYLSKKGVTLRWLHELQREGVVAGYKQTLDRLSHTCDSIIVSLDMDAVAQKDAPGVSAPSPNGLSASEIEQIAEICGANSKVKIMSIYEVNPVFDRDAQTSRLAASYMWNFMNARIRV